MKEKGPWVQKELNLKAEILAGPITPFSFEKKKLYQKENIIKKVRMERKILQTRICRKLIPFQQEQVNKQIRNDGYGCIQ